MIWILRFHRTYMDKQLRKIYNYNDFRRPSPVACYATVSGEQVALGT